MVEKDVLLKAWGLMQTARAMAAVYDENRTITKYVHSTSKGHEAIQIATALHLKSIDYAYPYYRDESMLLGFLRYYDLQIRIINRTQFLRQQSILMEFP